MPPAQQGSFSELAGDELGTTDGEADSFDNSAVRVLGVDHRNEAHARRHRCVVVDVRLLDGRRHRATHYEPHDQLDGFCTGLIHNLKVAQVPASLSGSVSISASHRSSNLESM